MWDLSPLGLAGLVGELLERLDLREVTLVVWARDDRVMPPEHGRRLADLLRQSRLVQVDDSYTLLPLDQPAALAALLVEFARNGAGTP